MNTIQRVRSKYPDRVPVIVRDVPRHIDLDKRKYLLPFEYNVSEFVSLLRGKAKLKPSQSLLIVIHREDEKIFPLCSTPFTDYDLDPQRAVEVSLLVENTFGSIWEFLAF